MEKFSLISAFVLMTLAYRSVAGPIEGEKSSTGDDLKTSETFGYGYYQPSIYSAPLISQPVPLATSSLVTAPLATTTGLSSGSAGYARSGYGYGSGYKFNGGYGYDNRWNYGNTGAVNQFYRHHPVYVAWG